MNVKRKKSYIKRKLIQIAAFGFSNVHAANLGNARIYTGKWKYFCNPGLHCYSCPAASFSCPIGALQAVNGSMKFSWSFYVTGFLLAAGVLFGRWICGFLCPFGLIQELIGKIPVKKLHLPKWCTYIKYFVLIWFVFLLPWIFKSQNLFGMGAPAFCKYICPSGLLTGGFPLLAGDENLRQVIGPLFFTKLTILVIVILGCILVCRFFCKTMCPLGAIYGLLNKVSIYHLEVDSDACISCSICHQVCRMDVDPLKNPDSAECIRCGECAAACPKQAIQLGFQRKTKKAGKS